MIPLRFLVSKEDGKRLFSINKQTNAIALQLIEIMPNYFKIEEIEVDD